MVTTILIIAVVIVIIVLLLSVVTTSKAYQYKHTIDPIEDKKQITEEENQK
jgi:cell division protein FtsL